MSIDKLIRLVRTNEDKFFRSEIEIANAAAKELARLRAVEKALREFIDEHLSDENCPTCLLHVTHHEPDCKAGALAAALGDKP